MQIHSIPYLLATVVKSRLDVLELLRAKVDTAALIPNVQMLSKFGTFAEVERRNIMDQQEILALLAEGDSVDQAVGEVIVEQQLKAQRLKEAGGKRKHPLAKCE